MIFVVKHGVYWQDLVGIFHSVEDAVSAATTVALAERDDYHHFVGYEAELDKFYPVFETRGEHEVFTLTRKTPGHPRGGVVPEITVEYTNDQL